MNGSGSRRAVWVTALVACALLASGCARASGQGVRVAGHRLERDGRPFTVHGVQIVGLVAPPEALRGQYLTAYQHFGAAELRAARDWGANTVRLQLSEPGLDPRSPLYSTAYVGEVRNAVRMARADGLIVILSLQDQSPSGEPDPWPMPTEETARAWAVLAPLFKTDRGVMYELFNEPALPANATDWRLWADGGTAPAWRKHAAFTAVGAQALIDQIRATGARNVIIVDGLQWAQNLSGQPALADPAQELAFAVHPYFGAWMQPNPVAAWNRNFGTSATREPVIVTEWSEDSGSTGCQQNFATLGTELVGYLQSRHIGLVGFAFDLPGTIVTGWNYAATSYAHFHCAVAGGGPGTLIQNWFLAR